ncbi:hypothetical protein [Microbacterium paludicola]|uniref:hypothetical protein n=1 Tax=Microbacterium paludicola TaxID=300019 RepID=UPI00119D45D9|nr:hypothetical protein [Microbacterium paludicola]
MPTYSNGSIPDYLLTTFKTGWNSTDGNWKHQLSPSTLRKHLALVARARKRTGKTLEISEGWGAYRPLNIQHLARRLYGNGAAWPGTSSHGGFWENKQTLAIDYGNWGWVYNWDRAAFYEDVRAVGLAPGLIHPSRGNDYPDEPWHVVDLDPWAPVPSGSASSAPAKPDKSEEDDEMANNVMYKTADSKYKFRAAVTNDVSGMWLELVGNDAGILNNLAGRYSTGDAIEVSASMFAAARSAAAQIRPRSELTVTVGDA